MWKRLSKTRLTYAASITTAVFLSSSAAAQTTSYPTKPVHIITPYAAGGSASVIARSFGDSMGKDLGQNFVVENRPGGGSLLGTEAVARSAPDGYNLLSISTTVVINPWTHDDLKFDTAKDLSPVSTLVRQSQMLVVHPAVPATNLKELVAYAKQNPGTLNAYSSGQGNSGHLTNLLFMKITGTQFTMVPYKGGGTVISDLLAGSLQMAINTPTVFIPHIKSGKLRAIGMTTERRIPALPDIPTFIEQGTNFTSGNWYMLLTRTGTPRDVIEKLNVAAGKAQAAREFQEFLGKQGIDVYPNNVAASENLFRSELKRYGEVIRENNVKAADDD